MEPNSIVLVVLLLAAAAGLLWLFARYQHVAVRIACGLLAIVFSATAGIAIVNDYYGYYQSWSQLSADFGGNYEAFASAPRYEEGSAATTVANRAPSGRLVRTTFDGAQSGIRRNGLVYLPPQYFEKQYADTRFPVIELIHGSPGSAYNWVVYLRIVQVYDRLLAEHVLGPAVLVMPTMNSGRHFEDCVNAPGVDDDTYISADIRTDMLAGFRVSTDPAEWGIAGYSSGGYCAVNLALRHRSMFGAAAIMDGYFRPQDGPAGGNLHGDRTALAANDPLVLAAALRPGAAPLPAFWVSAGTAGAGDYAAAEAFVSALHGVEQVTLYREPNAGHNFYAWSAALPHALPWLWSELAPPDLRTMFPVAGPPSSGEITGAVVPSETGSPSASSSTPSVAPPIPPTVRPAPTPTSTRP